MNVSKITYATVLTKIQVTYGLIFLFILYILNILRQRVRLDVFLYILRTFFYIQYTIITTAIN